MDDLDIRNLRFRNATNLKNEIEKQGKAVPEELIDEDKIMNMSVDEAVKLCRRYNLNYLFLFSCKFNPLNVCYRKRKLPYNAKKRKLSKRMLFINVLLVRGLHGKKK